MDRQAVRAHVPKGTGSIAVARWKARGLSSLAVLPLLLRQGWRWAGCGRARVYWRGANGQAGGAGAVV